MPICNDIVMYIVQELPAAVKLVATVHNKAIAPLMMTCLQTTVLPGKRVDFI